MKFGRTYRLKVQGQRFEHTLEFPLTLEFDVARSTFASANKGTFTLYNLKPLTRRDVYFDRFVNDQRLKLTLQAGYAGSPVLPTIFSGDVRVAWTQRQGASWVTHIEAFDGGFAFYNAMAGFTLPTGYTMQSAAEKAIATMRPFGVTLGKVSNISLPNSGSLTKAGNAWDVLKSIVPGDGQLFVDIGVCNILNPQDFITTPTIPEISPATGLIGTPRKQGNLTSCTTIFDPQYVVGQLARLNSLEEWMNNPRLKVMGLHHYGKISGAEGGDLMTDLSLFSGYDGTQLLPVDAALESEVA